LCAVVKIEPYFVHFSKIKKDLLILNVFLQLLFKSA
jgi:hypothetical protein